MAHIPGPSIRVNYCVWMRIWHVIYRLWGWIWFCPPGKWVSVKWSCFSLEVIIPFKGQLGLIKLFEFLSLLQHPHITYPGLLYLLCSTNRFYSRFCHELTMWLWRNQVNFFGPPFSVWGALTWSICLLQKTRGGGRAWKQSQECGAEDLLQCSAVIHLPCCWCPEDFPLMLIIWAPPCWLPSFLPP